VPLYPLYALLFADHGLSETEISVLFAIWSSVSVVTEVPSGALADHFSRRGALVAAGVLQASGYALWITLPGFTAFAAGFVLWGIGGSLVSGSMEALFYDGLAAAGAEAHYAQVIGRMRAVGLLAQLPAAGAATVLFSIGGYGLVGWVSIGCCLAAAALASRLPEPPRDRVTDEGGGLTGCFTTLRSGLAEIATRPPVCSAVLGVPLAGAAGAALGGWANRLRPSALAPTCGVAVLALGAAGLARQPAGMVFVAVFYGLYRLVLVVADARLQERICGKARATVTSVAGLGTELGALVLYGTWALGGVLLVALRHCCSPSHCLVSSADRCHSRGRPVPSGSGRTCRRLGRDVEDVDEASQQVGISGEAHAAVADHVGGTGLAGHEGFECRSGLDDEVRAGQGPLRGLQGAVVNACVDDDVAEAQFVAGAQAACGVGVERGAQCCDERVGGHDLLRSGFAE
jgi:MFS family permease